MIMRPGLPRTFRALRSRNYRLWAAGSLVSNTGNWMQRTAQDWIVLTVLTRHDATAVGIVTALQLGPQIVLLPWTGLVADRFNQRWVLAVTQVAMAACALLLGGLVLAGTVRLWEVQLLALLLGCAAAVDGPSRQSFVPALVDGADLSNAVALSATSFNLGRMIGPAVSGILITTVGSGWAFILNGASSAAVLSSLLLLRPAELRPQTRAQKGGGGFIAGLAYVRARPDLLTVLGMLALIGAFGLNFPIFISTMAVGVLHTDARGYGWLSSLLALGTVLGALLSAHSERPRFTVLVISSLCFGIACALAALAPGFWLFGLALLVIGVCALRFTNATTSLMQLTVAPEMRGRVLALRFAVFLGGAAIGAPIVGKIADLAGPRSALAVGSLSAFASALLGFVSFRGPPTEIAAVGRPLPPGR